MHAHAKWVVFYSDGKTPRDLSRLYNAKTQIRKYATPEPHSIETGPYVCAYVCIYIYITSVRPPSFNPI